MTRSHRRTRRFRRTTIPNIRPTDAPEEQRKNRKAILLFLPHARKYSIMMRAPTGDMGDIGHFGVNVLDVSVVDGHGRVDARQEEEGDQPEQRELHLSPVEDDVGQMGCDECVDAPGGPRQVDVGVRDGRAKGPRQNAADVDQENAPPSECEMEVREM